MNFKDDKAANLRRDYQVGQLSITDLNPNPFFQFKVWFDEAMSTTVLEPNAMTLATVNQDGRPSARVVLLKGYDQDGFVFYTNYQSEKSQQMFSNPNVALVFNWLEMARQIRIEGRVEKVSPQVSDEYFNKRPKGSRIGAWVSPQSQKIESRSILDENLGKMKNQFSNKENIPRPPFWGGYKVKPSKIEFWQGRTSRLHDRFVYECLHDNWHLHRKAP